MSYTHDITSEAAERLNDLIESLPTSRRADATEAVEGALKRLCANPLPKARDYLGHPAYEFTVRAGSATHHWGVAYRISEDETCIVITDCYKVPPPVL